jgi:hypothetical protein
MADGEGMGKPEASHAPVFNEIHGNFSGNNIISHEETDLSRHNPITERFLMVAPTNTSLDDDKKSGAGTKL